MNSTAADAQKRDETRTNEAAREQPNGAAAVAATTHTESSVTLRTVAATVQRIMRADTASVAALSLADQTITWKAVSGFRHLDAAFEKEPVNPLRGEFALRAASASETIIIQNIGEPNGPLAVDFPLHSADGVRDLALAPLRSGNEMLGALIVGFRSAHEFTENEKQLLEGLAEMASLALENARLSERIGEGKRIWEQTFDAISDGVIVHDHNLQIVRCNAHAAEMMELTPADIIGMSSADAFARLFGKRASAFHMKQVVHRTDSDESILGKPAASSFDLRAEDGRRYLVQVAPLEDASGAKTSSVITWSDVTELSDVQEQLSRSRKLATIGQLAAGVAHEINNPLAAVTTCAEAIQRDVRDDEHLRGVAEQLDWNFYLEEIVRQSLRCKAITRGLLDLSRQRRARREACDINHIAEQVVKLFQQRAAGTKVEFTVALDAEITEVATDEAMLRQVLDNLLSNALDGFANESSGGGRITVSTKAHGNERISIEVADTGRGIAPELLARIFEPFFTTKEAGRGSGLGLAICTTLAEALGGALTVESKHGAGSRFRLWIPRRAPEAV
ncbi:MAG: ATP-binding protein [Pyrinomonadaceae bacterium]